MEESKPVRVPSDVHAGAKTLAALAGTTPGDLLGRAFFEYVTNHQGELTVLFQHAQKFIASKDVPGLADLLSQSREQRVAEQVARRAADRG